MPSSHAMLGPSSAHRWIACPPSAKLELNMPDRYSVFAEEGTLAHSLCEAKLRRMVGEWDEEQYQSAVREVDPDPDMEQYSTQYKEFIEEELNAARAVDKSTTLLIEQKLDFTEYVPAGFGTSDAVIVSDKLLTVIDFKYGKGVPVNAVDNPQLRLYALGTYIALASLYDFDTVKTVVFQPRIENISDETIPLSELLDWAETVVKPAAKDAFLGQGKFKVGDHCRFCRAGAICRARAEEAFGVIEASEKKPDLLTDDEIAPILDKLDDTEKWIAAVRAYANEQAINAGKKWPGYKLVESRTIRKISDPIEAKNRLLKLGFSEEDFLTYKLKGVGELEKLVTKKTFASSLGDLVVKPVGEPTLVKESDRRPEINPIEEIFKEEP